MPKTINHIYSQQVSQIYAQSHISLLGVVVAALVSLLIFWEPHRATQLGLWLSAQTLVSLVRYILIIGYKRDKQQEHHCRKWANRYLLLELISGLVWSTLIITILPSTDIEYILTLLIVGTMMMIGLPVLFFVRSIYAAFLFSLSLSTIAILIVIDQPYSFHLALFTFIYCIALWVSANASNQRNIQSLELTESFQLTNRQLVRQSQETQRAEQNARESESRFRTLANATSEGVVLYENGRIVDCNENINRMLGYTREQLLKKNIEQLFVQADRFQILDLLSHNDGIPYEFRAEDRDGFEFPVELVKRRLPLENRNLYVFTMRDISELKHMSEIKDQFISTVSHELRTPITSIHASLGLILGGVTGEVPEKIQQLLNIAHQNSERLNLLINDILDIQKLDIGKLNFSYETLNVLEILKHCIQLNSGFIDKHHIEVLLDETQKDIFIHVDRDRFIQVITNLLSNAAKFSPQESQVRIELNQQGELLQIHIHDQGAGIPDEFRKKIFQRFSQADASNTRIHGGSGLGLYISKQILHEMKGDISFASEAGKGTTFTITLPVARK